ncbi:MAG: hypothetical protein KDI90_04045 [Alphaproteobacteria bacterium]|nr:hypothetical protein [Alphaproteobacteria bacterium]MCB9974826.1 hypothetical protein [Rhodospirillales bacterium]
MTGPISGVNPQQVPFSQSFQTGNNEQQQARETRNAEETQTPEQDRIQVRGTALNKTGQVEETKAKQAEEEQKTQDQTRNRAANLNSNQDNSLRRGSLVDVVV